MPPSGGPLLPVRRSHMTLQNHTEIARDKDQHGKPKPWLRCVIPTTAGFVLRNRTEHHPLQEVRSKTHVTETPCRKSPCLAGDMKPAATSSLSLPEGGTRLSYMETSEFARRLKKLLPFGIWDYFFLHCQHWFTGVPVATIAVNNAPIVGLFVGCWVLPMIISY